MPNPRLLFALQQIPSTDWEFFERFAAEFLAEDYPGLRTTASPHGDKGRDGELFEVATLPTYMVQYSLAADWGDKIRKTVKRLRASMPQMQVLVYVTARKIGADADDLKMSFRADGLTLDVLDQSYFTDRELTTGQRKAASREMIERIVDPLLREREVISRIARPLEPSEARVAVLHLALDAADEGNERNLTKTCFESLVLAALHDTSASLTMTSGEVYAKVQSYLPNEREQQVRGQTESALARLSKKHGQVKFVRVALAYHLTFQEQQKLSDKSADFLRLQAETSMELFAYLPPDDIAHFSETQQIGLGESMRTACETLLLRRGEQFADFFRTGELRAPTEAEVNAIWEAVGTEFKGRISTTTLQYAMAKVFRDPSSTMRSHLQSLSDAYTMFAFLRQTPDVQKVANQLFTDGQIWLDTSMVLPLLAETAEDDRHRKPYTVVIQAAQASGIQFFVTQGVIEEVETHIFNSRTYALGTPTPWRGQVPFLFTSYMASGRPRPRFASWVEEFRSDSRPQEDVESYLSEALSIERQDLAEVAQAANVELRSAVQEHWAVAHEQRRNSNRPDMDNATMVRLVAHDVENTVGGSYSAGFECWG